MCVCVWVGGIKKGCCVSVNGFLFPSCAVWRLAWAASFFFFFFFFFFKSLLTGSYVMKSYLDSKIMRDSYDDTKAVYAIVVVILLQFVFFFVFVTDVSIVVVIKTG